MLPCTCAWVGHGWPCTSGRPKLRSHEVHAPLDPALLSAHVHVSMPWPSQEECCIAGNTDQFDIGMIKDDKFFIK